MSLFDDFADYPGWPPSIEPPTPPPEVDLYEEKQRLITENIRLQERIDCNNARITEIRHKLVIKPIVQRDEAQS